MNHQSQRGFCVPFNLCGFLISKLNERTQESLYFLQQSQCGYYQFTTFVCCPQQSTQSSSQVQPQNRRIESPKLLPKAPACGVSLDDRIIGGSKTTITEFPWFALLKFTRRKKKTFSCLKSFPDPCYLSWTTESELLMQRNTDQR